MTFVLVECYEADPTFDYTTERRRDSVIWRLVTDQPYHLLDPEYSNWKDLLVAAADAAVASILAEYPGTLRNRVWSERNVSLFRHPLSAGIPLASRWLDMPRHDLPGDLYTPRVHFGVNGASERMVVSPGREAEGIMHMPVGQSGHPLSPFYRAGHEDWAAGRATPFLPGRAAHVLALLPPGA